MLTTREFGEWAKEAWPRFSDAVLDELAVVVDVYCTTRPRSGRLQGFRATEIRGLRGFRSCAKAQSSAKSGRTSSSKVASSQLATTHGVIAVTVAVRGTRIVSATSPKNSPGLEDAPLAERRLRDARNAGEKDEETIAGLALADQHRAGRDLLALHAVGELAERLAGQAGEQPDARELGHGRGDVARRHRSTVPTPSLREQTRVGS